MPYRDMQSTPLWRREASGRRSLQEAPSPPQVVGASIGVWLHPEASLVPNCMLVPSTDRMQYQAIGAGEVEGLACETTQRLTVVLYM